MTTKETTMNYNDTLYLIRQRASVDSGGALEQSAAFYSRQATLLSNYPPAYPSAVAYFEAKARCYTLAAMWGRLAVL